MSLRFCVSRKGSLTDLKTNRTHTGGTIRRPHILFDFDGTLVNTTPLILRSFHATWIEIFGMTTVAVNWGPFPRHELENALPDHLLERPADLLDILG